MWMVDPKLMCNKHLCGEHLECHMLAGTILKRKNLKGYVNNNLVEVTKLKERHDILSEEMKKRGLNHKSSLLNYDLSYLSQEIINFKVNVVESYQELLRRCPKCRERQLKHKV